MDLLRVLMIGDVVGEPGLTALETRLPQLVKDNSVCLTVVNGENAADGFGLSEAAMRRILAAGADLITSGNHVWEKRDFWTFLDTEERILRPANYPAWNGSAKTPGRGWIRIDKAAVPDREKALETGENGGAAQPVSVLLINLQGRELMTAIDCPFRCFDSIFEAEYTNMEREVSASPPVILVDFHAEATREKEALAYYLDSRASLVVGTHTHVQTADERILPGGTAYISDLGMTGITDSVIGMDPQVCLDRSTRQILYRMVLAGESKAEAVVQGIIAEIDCKTGRAASIRRI